VTGIEEPGCEKSFVVMTIAVPLIFETSVAECKLSVSKSYHVVTKFSDGLRSCLLTCNITS
jgi:hypothetical protein